MRHLVGLQSQVPHNPYTGLWSRLAEFRPESLSKLLEDRDVVRIGVMRGTIHLITADDCLLLRPLTQPVFEGQLWRHRDFSPHLRGVDLDPVVEAGRTALEEPRTGTELRAFLAARFPKLDAAALAYACQMRLALVQVPPRGLWGKSAQVRWTTAETWLGRPLAADPPLDAVVLRYLAAFGPASVADVATWCRLTGLRQVVERLRPQLVTLPDERGRELFDLPDAPRPDPDSPAPVRFLPEYDNLLLSHDDRSRFVSDLTIARCCDRCGRSAGARCSTTAASAPCGVPQPGGLVVRHVPLAKRGLAAISAEGRRLARFLELEPRRATRARQPVRPAPRRVSASAPRSEANASASGISIPCARANVSPAAKQSPAPYASSNGPGGAAGL